MAQQIALRKFAEADIPNKVRWINDPEVNRYLHYDVPLTEEKTHAWYLQKKADAGRSDYVIEAIAEGKPIPVGLVGLLNIDSKNRKAEFYIAVGEKGHWGKGVAAAASTLFIRQCFRQYGLNKIYCFTETGNLSAQRLFEKLGFKKEGSLREDLIHNGQVLDRFAYGLLKREFCITDDAHE
ncbi:MAG TPA: GNAT family protein [Candidatus Deferrimicrobium sp.]|nr:GNAT family protein [Candidatus Deferrimicrobium sp.]